MTVSVESGSSPGGERWILLIHHLPPEPAYLRVKVRRQLSRIGAVVLKNSVYVMPNTGEALEDVEWLRRLIVDEGGWAMICTASLVGGVTDRDLEAMFTTQSGDEYRRIVDAAEAAMTNPTAAHLRRLERSLAAADQRSFFPSAEAAGAERAVSAVEHALTGNRDTTTASGPEVTVPRSATWVTRRGVFIDRIASAWLIRRFIDTGATFKFVGAIGYRPTAGEVRFDMFEGEFTHQGDRCTFEVLVQRFAPNDPALVDIGEIVHDIDIKDEKFGREEAVGVAALVRGIVASHDDDTSRLEVGATIFDGLYAVFSG